MTIQMKDTEQFFPVILLLMLYKVVLTVKYMKPFGLAIPIKAIDCTFVSGNTT